MKPGDLVKLRSGGPPMTVESIQPSSRSATCVWAWRDESGWQGVFRETFLLDVLEITEETDL